MGCGKTVADGWLNLDRSPSVLLSRHPLLRRALGAARVLTPEQTEGIPTGVVRANVARSIPVEDTTADYVYSSHMVEHLSRWECARFIRECRRVLRPGAILRIATPDLERMIRDYVDGTSPFLASRAVTAADAFCLEYRAYENPDSNPVSRLARKLAGGDSHQWLYDHESLTRLLLQSGFTDVTSCSYRQGATPDLELVEHRQRGLFLEARAPDPLRGPDTRDQLGHAGTRVQKTPR